MADQMKEKLIELKELHSQGLITDDEYAREKSTILSSSGQQAPVSVPSELLGATTLAPTSSAQDSLEGALTGATTFAGAASTDQDVTQSNQPESAPSSARVISSGEKLDGRYNVIRKLGEGGMGTVYQAYDEDVHQEVAVKVISPEWAGNTAVFDSLKREVSSARRLPAHENLLRIFDVHFRADPPFFALELVKGGDLEDRWYESAKRLKADETRELMVQILSGLGALHDAKVVHLDIKPQNILLSDKGVPKITDYGITKSVSEQVKSNNGGVSGSLFYMSPEQLSGGICDRRSDIYSAGIMCYQLLKGEFPFRINTKEEVETWHKTGLRHFSGLPAPFDVVVPKMVSADVNKRYDSVADVIEALNPKAKPSRLPAPAPAPVAQVAAPIVVAPLAPEKPQGSYLKLGLLLFFWPLALVYYLKHKW
jgi:serine/threonine protein kinase